MACCRHDKVKYPMNANQLARNDFYWNWIITRRNDNKNDPKIDIFLGVNSIIITGCVGWVCVFQLN